jgi:hypothetical protein
LLNNTRAREFGFEIADYGTIDWMARRGGGADILQSGA